MPDTTSILANRLAVGADRTAGGTPRAGVAVWKEWLASNATELKLIVLIGVGAGLARLMA